MSRVRHALGEAVRTVVESLEARSLMSVSIGAYGAGADGGVPMDGATYALAIKPEPGQNVSFSMTAKSQWTGGPSNNPDIKFVTAVGAIQHITQGTSGVKIATVSGGGPGVPSLDSETSMYDVHNGTFYPQVYVDSDGQTYQYPRFVNADGEEDQKVNYVRKQNYFHVYGHDLYDYAYRTITLKKAVTGDTQNVKFDFTYGGEGVWDIKASAQFFGFTGPMTDQCAPVNSTSDPVRYADGAARLDFNDFLPTNSPAFSLGRSWSNKSHAVDQGDQSAFLGNGIALGGMPYLQDLTNQMQGHGVSEMPEGSPSGFAVVESSSSAYAVYQNYGNVYENTADSEQRKSRFSNSGNKIIQIDPDGTVTTYANFLNKTVDPVNGWTPKQMGRLISRVSPNGDGLFVKWDLAHDRPEYYRVVAKKVSGGGYVADQFTFGYDNTRTDYNNNSFVGSVTQSKGELSAVDDTLLSSSHDVRTVEYEYYDDPSEDYENANGVWGDLKYVIKHDGGISSPVVETNYYRWMMPTWTSPGQGIRLLKSAMGNDSYLKAVQNVGDIESASDGDLSPYVDNAFTYTSDNKVLTETVSGTGAGCSCGKTGIGTYTFDYYENTGTESGLNAWRYRTTVGLPDGNQDIVYTNGSGQVLLTVTYDQSNQKYYSKWYQYDSNGNVIRQAEGKAILPYNSTTRSSFEGFADLVGYGKTSSKLSGSARVDVTNYFTALDTADKNLYSYQKSTGYQIGAAGAFVKTQSWDYGGGGVGDANNDGIDDDGIFNVQSETQYPTDAGTSGQRVTTYAYTWWPEGSRNSAQAKTITTTHAKLVGTQNGADTTLGDSSYQTKSYFDSAGRVVWYVDGNGYITYTEYDALTGSKTKQINDADPAVITTSSVAGPARNPLLGAALKSTTDIESDSQGRQTKVTDPNDNITYTVYDDTTADNTPRRTLTYTGWNATTQQPTGPVYATIDDPATGIKDTITYTWTGSGGLETYSNGFPKGNETFGSSDFHLQSLVREIRNVSGQVVEVREYTDFGSLTYSLASANKAAWIALGTAGTNYLSTKYKYDSGARLFQTTTPDGTITMSVYDARGLLQSQWKGTDNTGGTETDPDGSGGSNNMVKVASFTYDDSGNQLTSTSYSGTASYTTTYQYDARDRLTDAIAPDKTWSHYTYNNLDEQTQIDTYVDANANGQLDAGEWTGKSTTAYDDQGRVYQSSVYQGSRVVSALGSDDGSVAKVMLKGHGFVTGQSVTIAGASQAAYNGTFTITVDNADQFHYTPGGSLVATATGSRITVAANKRLTTNYWYDKNGNLAKTVSPSGLIQKTFYDGAGRVIRDATSIDATEVASGEYDDALTLTGDQVIEQNDYWLDKAGRTRITTNWQRNSDDSPDRTGSASLGHYYHTSVAYFYDAVNRLTSTMDYGRDGSESSSANSSTYIWLSADPDTEPEYIDGFYNSETETWDNANGIPDAIEVTPDLDNFSASTDTNYDWIYTGYAYDDAGNLWKVTDNANRQTRYAYDLAGRKTAMVENYVNGTASETETDTDRTTLYGYDTFGRLSTQTALNPLGSGLGVQSQVTKFAYSDDTDRSRVSATLYGDTTATVSTNSSGKGTVTGSDGVFTTYDRLGRKVTETDQRGVTHTYAYDSTGRLQTDSIGTGTLPSGVDGKVRTIVYEYDDQGRVEIVTSKGATANTVNTVGFVYDAWGNVIQDIQSHYGSLSDSRAKTTSYVYEDGSGTGTDAQYVRLAKTVYPSGSSYTTQYTSSGIDAALVRSTGIADSSNTTLVSYTYRGLGEIVKTARPVAGISLSEGTAGNSYENLDRYGRWQTIDWEGSATLDARSYTYDRMGNRLTQTNSGGGYADRYSETYAYDGLNRLVDWKIGQMSGGSIVNVFGAEQWTLDSLGNWRSHGAIEYGSGATSYRTDTRTVNAANEITTYTGTRTNGVPLFAPTYDAAGNIIHTGRSGNETAPIAYDRYDGWGRQVISDTNNSGSITDWGDTRTNYDGLGRMIGQFVDTVQDSTNNVGTTEEHYYNTNGQIIEVYTNTVSGGVVGTTPKLREQTVWDDSYVNAAAVQNLDSNADGTLNQRLYTLWDANYNVIALAADHGYAVERYFWSPYGGAPSALNGQKNYDGTTTDEGSYDWGYDWTDTDYASFGLGFQGMRWDGRSGEYRTMTRAYLPSLGTFASRDPLGTAYQDGMNLYLANRGNPASFTDPSGTKVVEDWSPAEAFNWWQFAGGGEAIYVTGKNFLEAAKNSPDFQSDLNASVYPKLESRVERIIKTMKANDYQQFTESFEIPNAWDGQSISRPKAPQMGGYRWFGFGSVYYQIDATVIIDRTKCASDVTIILNAKGRDHYHGFVTSGSFWGGMWRAAVAVENVATGGGWLYGRSYAPTEYDIFWNFFIKKQYKA